MKTWFNLHLILSLFFLPLLVAYAITGGMYMAGAPAQLGSETITHRLSTPEASPGELTMAALQAEGVELPEGEWRRGKTGKHMLGNSAGRHLQFSRDEAAGQAIVEEVTPGLYPQMLLIHKGKAGLWFSILGYGAAASMLLLYLSGLAIVWKNHKKRPLMLVSLVLGCAAVAAGLVML